MLRIGLLLPKSGEAATIGQPLIDAAVAAADAVNAAGGVLGQPVELVTDFDEGDDRGQARDAIAALIDARRRRGRRPGVVDDRPGDARRPAVGRHPHVLADGDGAGARRLPRLRACSSAPPRATRCRPSSSPSYAERHRRPVGRRRLPRRRLRPAARRGDDRRAALARPRRVEPQVAVLGRGREPRRRGARRSAAARSTSSSCSATASRARACCPSSARPPASRPASGRRTSSSTTPSAARRRRS